MDLSAAAHRARVTEAQLLTWYQEGTLVATPTPDGELDISPAEARAARTRAQDLRYREAARLHAEFRRAGAALVAGLPAMTGAPGHVRWARSIRDHRLRAALEVGVVCDRRTLRYSWMLGSFATCHDPLLLASISALCPPDTGSEDDGRPYFWPCPDQALAAVRTALTDGDRAGARFWLRTRGLGGTWGTDPVDRELPVGPVHYGGTTTYPWTVVRDSGAGSPRDHVLLYLGASGLDPDGYDVDALTATYLATLTQYLPHDLTATGAGFVGTHRSDAYEDIRTAYERTDLGALTARHTRGR
ncbi:hypothetical protein [Kitasatospora sp. NPDC059327]|uniref:hypothetical protein n=1 Tax=Kitasatospora sp. NPDC059327 TaxID=3346803 RepID=UPI0036CFDE4B